MRTTGRIASLVVTAVCALGLASPAAGDTFRVTRTNDPNPGNCLQNDCSLREAVLAANDAAGPDKVVLPNRRRPYRLTIANTIPTGAYEGAEGDLDVVGDPLILRHKGRGRATIDQRAVDRVIEGFARLKLRSAAVTGGEIGDTASIDGGGIHTDSRLVLVQSKVFRNHGDDGGALNFEGDGTLLLLPGSAILNNRSDDDAGAFTIAGEASDTVNLISNSRIAGNRAGSPDPTTEHGGAIDLSTGGSRLVVRNSTFADNRTAADGGAIYSDNPDRITIEGSTFTGNRAVAGGGALLLANGSDARIVNSTFDGRLTASSGGAILAVGAEEVLLNAVTVVRNEAEHRRGPRSPETGAGLSNDSTVPFTVENSLIALNRLGNGTRNDCTGTPFESGGGNVISTRGPSGVCVGLDAASDIGPQTTRRSGRWRGTAGRRRRSR